MKNIMIACKPNNLQCKSFKTTLLSYTEDKNYSINWTFASEDQIESLVNNEDFNLVLLSPEVLIYKSKITPLLESNGLPFLEIKGSDYGLRRMDNFFSSIKDYI